MVDFDAAEIAQGIQELYEPLAEDKGLTLVVRTQSTQMHGNRELISQALANLVENAIKYGEPTKQTRKVLEPAGADPLPPELPAIHCITVESRSEPGHVILSVSDHGSGIPEAERARAIERFVRLEASRTQPGSGLGLSLAAAVATLHGGELRLSDNNPGLVASLVLPLRGGEQPSA